MRYIAMAVVVTLVSATAPAQVRRRPSTASNPVASTGAYNLPAATFHGSFKRIKGKDLFINTGEDAEVAIHFDRKTKFLKGGKPIKPSDIEPGSVLSIDVSENPDLTPEAVNVVVDSGPV